MVAALRLVPPVAPVKNVRPFSTYYYAKNGGNRNKDWHRIGHASSRVGALRAAVVKLIRGQYYRAFVHDEDGVVIYRLTRSGGKIQILGQFMENMDG